MRNISMWSLCGIVLCAALGTHSPAGAGKLPDIPNTSVLCGAPEGSPGIELSKLRAKLFEEHSSKDNFRVVIEPIYFVRDLYSDAARDIRIAVVAFAGEDESCGAFLVWLKKDKSGKIVDDGWYDLSLYNNAAGWDYIYSSLTDDQLKITWIEYELDEEGPQSCPKHTTRTYRLNDAMRFDEVGKPTIREICPPAE